MTIKPNTSPGIDYLSGEFYKKCKDQLIGILGKIVFLMPGQRQDSGFMVRSSGNSNSKERLKKTYYTSPQDYRPIFILNLDYKILMKILAKKLNSVLDQYIHRDQAGFM